MKAGHESIHPALAFFILCIGAAACACGGGGDQGLRGPIPTVSSTVARSPNNTISATASPTGTQLPGVEEAVHGIKALMDVAPNFQTWALRAKLETRLGQAPKGPGDLCKQLTTPDVLDANAPDSIWPPDYKELAKRLLFDVCIDFGGAITGNYDQTISTITNEVNPLYERLSLDSDFDIRNSVIARAKAREAAR